MVVDIEVYEEVYIAPNVIVRFDPNDFEARRLVEEALRERKGKTIVVEAKAVVTPVNAEKPRVYRAKIVRR